METLESRKSFAYRLYPSKAQTRRLDAVLETGTALLQRPLGRAEDGLRGARRDGGQGGPAAPGQGAQGHQPLRRRRPQPPPAGGGHRPGPRLPGLLPPDARRSEAPGYPRFKGRDRFRSVGLKEYGNGFKVDGRRLKVHGIGRVAVRWHRPVEGQIKTLRLTRKAGRWYATFSCVWTPTPLPATGRAVGVDVGLHHLLATSDGRYVEHPHHYREGQRRLRVLQRTVARRKKGTASRREAVRRLQRHHERVANQRRDFLNKVAHRLLTDYDLIALEALRIPNLVRNRHLAKSILDAGWGYLARHLTRKAASAGRAVRLVDPAYTQPGLLPVRAPLRGAHARGPLGALPGLWPVPGQGPQRRRHHPASGGTRPSGHNRGGGPGVRRSRRALARAECHRPEDRPRRAGGAAQGVQGGPAGGTLPSPYGGCSWSFASPRISPDFRPGLRAGAGAGLATRPLGRVAAAGGPAGDRRRRRQQRGPGEGERDRVPERHREQR